MNEVRLEPAEDLGVLLLADRVLALSWGPSPHRSPVNGAEG